MLPIPRPARTTTAVALVGAALALSGCGGDDPTVAAPTAAASSSDPATSTSSAPSGSASPSTSSSSGPSESSDAVLVDLTVADGTVTTGSGQAPADRVEVPLGGTLRLSVTSDAADEVHVHGYDRTLELVPGATVVLELTTDIPGVFEVELHESGLPLPSLQVQ